MREALDSALRYSSSTGELATALRDMGYEFACEQTRKYPTIRRIGDKKAVRLRRLGEQYEVEAISRRLEENREWHGSGLLYRVREREARTYTPPLRRYVRGNLKRAKKPGGLRGLYLHYCFLLGILPKGSKRRPLSPEMREECRRLDELSHQAQLLCWEKLVTGDDVQRFVKTKQDELQTLTAVRSRCYNRLRRCDDPETVETVRRERSALTGQIAACRKDIRTAQVVLQRSAAMSIPRTGVIPQERCRNSIGAACSGSGRCGRKAGAQRKHLFLDRRKAVFCECGLCQTVRGETGQPFHRNADRKLRPNA